jgi:nickel/cobalt transporter (NiCoT) family protein
MNSSLWLALALGLRHGTDPDHLTAIDGLSRIRPRLTNGLFFALGHGLIVTVLAAGVGHVIADRFASLGPWMLIGLGVLNLWRVLRPLPSPSYIVQGPVLAQPFLLGIVLAAGFETASQLTALIIAGQTNPWLVGGAFSIGLALVDGLDGYLAASTMGLAVGGPTNARRASRALGIIVVIFSFGLGAAELLRFEINQVALPLGLTLFALVIAVRLWARRGQSGMKQSVSVRISRYKVPSSIA